MIREIQSLPSRNVFIIDDNIVSHRGRTQRLFEALAPLRIRQGNQCTISIARDPEILELAVQSGCVGLAIGFESFCKESLEGAHKRFNHPERFYGDIETIKRYGILIWGSFVLGFDEDNEQSLENTIQMAKPSKLDFACFNFLTPLPGTTVHDKFTEEGRLVHKNWADYNMVNLIFRPARVTGSVLEKACEGRGWNSIPWQILACCILACPNRQDCRISSMQYLVRNAAEDPPCDARAPMSRHGYEVNSIRLCIVNNLVCRSP